MGRIPLGRIPLGRIPISRCPLSRIPFSRTSLYFAKHAISAARIACCRRPLFLNDVPRIHQTFRCVIYIDHLYIYVYLLYRLGYSSNVCALSKRLRVRVRVRAASDLRSFELRAFRPMSCILVLCRPLYFIVVVSCMPIVTYFCSYVVT